MVVSYNAPAEFLDEVLCVSGDFAGEVNGVNTLQDNVVRLHRVRPSKRRAG